MHDWLNWSKSFALSTVVAVAVAVVLCGACADSGGTAPAPTATAEATMGEATVPPGPAGAATPHTSPTPDRPTAATPSTTAESAPTARSASPTPEPPPTDWGPNGAPLPADTPEGLAAQIRWAHAVIDDPAAPLDLLDTAAHVQQVAYRFLGANPDWDDDVVAALDPALAARAVANAAARRGFAGLLPEPPTSMPPWRIIAPEPAEVLQAHYRSAEAEFGIPWQYLAAVNFVETGFGRIRGLSTAGAQGPMQFMPATWDAYGAGGDVNDPADAIMAAGRYLAEAAGGPAEAGSDALRDALWAYNHHDSYVAGVEAYARLMIDDPRAYHGYHQWEIYYWTAAGTVWLPVGFHDDGSTTAADYVAAHPQAHDG